MSSEIAIKVENLSKSYLTYSHPQDRLKQFLVPRFQEFLGKQKKNYFKEFYALQDVSFEVEKGETVGIVGRNGSGKSTLLQIICGVLAPTAGTVQTNGRVVALLELGSGFNPDFTGRENVYLNGTVLGLSRAEIDSQFDNIASFADIGEFIEQPVKTYSSGMALRLAFAVAISADPQILIVDEALSVGDELFQRKCFSRIEKIKSLGSTILFVSHSGSTIIDLCDRALLFDAGLKLAFGIPKQIVGQYYKLIYAPEEEQVLIREQIRLGQFESLLSPSQFEIQHKTAQSRHLDLQESYDPGLTSTSTIAYESLGVLIQPPMILTLDGHQVNNLIKGRTYRYTYQVSFDVNALNVRFGMLIKNTIGTEIGGGVTASSPRSSIPFIKQGSVYRVTFRFECILNPGVYFLNAGVIGEINGTEVHLHRLLDIAMFRVIHDSNHFSSGIVDFSIFPEVEEIK